MNPWILAGAATWVGIIAVVWALVYVGCSKPTPTIEEPCGCEPCTPTKTTYAEIRDRAMLDLVRDPREVVYAADARIEELEARLAASGAE